MIDARSVALVLLAAGCASLAAGHWTATDRKEAAASGAIGDQQPAQSQRRLLDVAQGKDCVERCADPAGVHPLVAECFCAMARAKPTREAS